MMIDFFISLLSRYDRAVFILVFLPHFFIAWLVALFSIDRAAYLPIAPKSKRFVAPHRRTVFFENEFWQNAANDPIQNWSVYWHG